MAKGAAVKTNTEAQAGVKATVKGVDVERNAAIRKSAEAETGAEAEAAAKVAAVQ